MRLSASSVWFISILHASSALASHIISRPLCDTFPGNHVPAHTNLCYAINNLTHDLHFNLTIPISSLSQRWFGIMFNPHGHMAPAHALLLLPHTPSLPFLTITDERLFLQVISAKKNTFPE